MRKLITFSLIAVFSVFLSAPSSASNWVEKSDENAQIVLNALAELSPEGAGRLGVDGLDEEITDLAPGINERSRQINVEILDELQRRLESEGNLKVRQDLGILIKSLEDNIRSSDLNFEQMLPYYNINQTIFFGIRGIIDPQNSRERYPAAIARLQKYAGILDGHEPFAQLAKDRTRERFDVEGLVGPYRGQVEQDLEKAETMITGIREIFAGTDLEGWEESYEKAMKRLPGNYATTTIGSVPRYYRVLAKITGFRRHSMKTHYAIGASMHRRWT
jgi:hypothetical protein